MYTLTIGQKAYSSWSLRGWLLLAAHGLAFREKTVRLYQPEFDAFAKAHAPGRTVPLLEWDEGGRARRVWDSLAIAETLAERHPDAGIWPADPHQRQVARMVAAEMHSGFMGIRSHCPMNLHRSARKPKLGLSEAASDAERAGTLWSWALDETGGPWLGGPSFSAADAFMAPLVTRLVSYDLVTVATEGYVHRLLMHAKMVEWTAAALADRERIALYEDVP